MSTVFKGKTKVVPAHVAIVMDGNRRWAQNKGLPPMVGHWKGADVLTQIVEAASDLGIKTLTVYSFSQENWNRAPLEVSGLMRLLNSYIRRRTPEMIKKGVRLQVIGDLEKLPFEVQETLKKSIDATSAGKAITLVLALNYGGRDELTRAIKKVARSVKEGALQPEAIDEALIGENLDTAPFGELDLFIRTSGEWRVSNFLLWQLYYAEMWITEVLWPDFTKKHLEAAIEEYATRNKRYGT